MLLSSFLFFFLAVASPNLGNPDTAELVIPARRDGHSDFGTYSKRQMALPYPGTVELVIPAAPIVLTNSTIRLGIHNSAGTWSRDHVWNISTSIFLPDGLTLQLVTGPVLGGCTNSTGNETYLGEYIPPIAGIYTILWNVTYIFPTKPDGEGPNCGPPPYNSEMWWFNRQLTVQDTANGQTATPRPTSTSLGSAGTGNPEALTGELATITTKLPFGPAATGNAGSRLLPTRSPLVVALFGAVILGPATW